MTYDPTTEYDRAEGAAVREEAARLYNALAARLPQTPESDRIKYIRSDILIAWWNRIISLSRDILHIQWNANEFLAPLLKDLQTDVRLMRTDIVETLHARQYEMLADVWYSPKEAKYWRWQHGLTDAELKLQHELSEWDERRDERER